MTSFTNNGTRCGGCLKNKNGRNRWVQTPPTSLVKFKKYKPEWKKPSDHTLKKDGWIKPPGLFRRKEITKEVSKREVYRNKEKYGLLPARKMWLIEMDPLWCADLTLINSKFIMKMLWTLDSNEMLGINEEGVAWAMTKYKRAWLQASGPTMYERMLPIEPMPDEYVDCSPEGSLRLKKLLVRILVKEGGPITMSNKERLYRPDAVGDVMKSMVGHIAYPCAPKTPIVRCGVCNCYNLYSHIDQGESIKDVDWRCACCYADMNYEVVQQYDVVADRLHFDAILGIHGGSQLDEQMLMNYGDVYEDLTLKAQRDFVAKDVALIRKYYNNSYQCVVEVGVNMSDTEKESLRNEFPRLSYVFKPRSTHGSKSTMYSLKSLIADNRPRGRKTPLIVSGYNQPLYPDNLIEVNPDKAVELVVMKDELWSVNKLLSATESLLRVIVPIVDSDFSGITSTLTIGNSLFYQFGATGTVGQIALEVLEFFDSTDAVVVNNGIVTVQLTQETNTWKLYTLTKMGKDATLDGWKRIVREKPKLMDIPLPDFYGALSNTAVQTWKTQTVSFDLQLLNMLIIRNITGNLGFMSLREFAVGYAMRSYSAQGRVSKNLHVMYEMVDAHTLIALLMCDSMKAATTLNKGVELLQTIPVIKSAALDVTNDLLQLVTTGARLMMSQLVGMRVETLFEKFAFKTSEIVRGWDENCGELTDLVAKPITNLAPLRWRKIHATTRLMPKCGHHHNCSCKRGKPACLCCSWAQQQTGGLCECCASKSSLDLFDYIKYINADPPRDTNAKPGRPERIGRKGKTGAADALISAVKPQKQLIVAANKAMRNLAKATIGDDDNEYVTPGNVTLSQVIRNPSEFFKKNSLPASKKWHSVIRYNFKDDSVATSDWFTVLKVDVVPDKPDSNCARESFMQATGYDIPTDELLGDDEDGLVSAKEIINLARRTHVNMLVCHAHGALIYQDDQSNQFATIVHGSLLKDIPTNHFMAGEVIQTGLIRPYPNRVWHVSPTLVDECIQAIDPLMNADSVSHNVALIVDSMISTEIINPTLRFDDLMPRVQQINGITVFTNNPEGGVHNVYSGKVHVELRSELAAPYNLLHDDNSMSHRDASVSMPFDRLTLDISNLEADLNAELRAEVKNWLATVNTFNQGGKINHHDVKAHLTVEVRMVNGLFEINDPHQKLKTMDIAFMSVMGRTIKVMMIMDRPRGKVILRPRGTLVDGKHKMYILKTSFSSLIRKLTNAGLPQLHFKHAAKLMSEMKLICGGGGSGKTEALVKSFKDGDLAVAMTRAPIDTIVARLEKFGKQKLKSRVMTLERASTAKPTITGTIYADEAKQLSLMALLPIITLDTQLIVLVGDTSQAGAVDQLNYAIGERKVFNLTEAVSDERVTELKKSMRIGYPLADQVGLLLPGFVGNADKQTTWKLHHFSGLIEKVELEIRNMIMTTAPDVVLTAQHENATLLRDLIKPKTKPEVSTIFSYQSKEAKNVLLVIMPNSNGHFGISRDRWMLISALTRAENHIDIVVVNSQAGEINVDELVDVLGGQMFSKRSFEMSVEDQQKTADDSTRLYPGTTVKVTKSSDGVTYDISGPWNAFKGSMTYKDGVVSVSGDKLLTDQLRKSIDTTEINVIDDTETIDRMSLSKLRSLTWIIDSVIGEKLGLRFFADGGHYRITKTKACPFNAGITVWREQWLKPPQLMFKILSGTPKSYIGQRYLKVDTLDQFCEGLLNWLEVVVGGKSYLGDCCLDKLTIPYNIDGKMLFERLQRIPQCIMAALSTCTLDSNCGKPKRAMQLLTAHVVRDSGIKLNKAMEHVVCHKLLLIRKQTILGGIYYDIYENDRKTKIVNTKWNIEDQIPIWQLALNDAASLGAVQVCGELEGLNMSLAKHKEHNTAAYNVYRNKMSAIKSYTINALDNTIWVSKGRLHESKILIQTATSNVYINEHNYKVADSLAELLDGYLLLHAGAMGKGKTITYAGLEPLLPSLYNMHYMKLWYTSDNAVQLVATRDKFSSALDQVRSFMTAITEDVDVDVAQDVRSTVVVNPADVGSRVILGTALMYTPLTTIVSWLSSGCEEVYGFVPTPEVDDRLAMLTHSNNETYLVSNFSGVVAPIQPEVLNYALGWAATQQLGDNSFLAVETTDVILGMALVKLTVRRTPQPYIAMIQPRSSGDNMMLEMPWLQTNIKDIMKSKKLLVVKQLVVKPHMFRSLCMRCLLDTNVRLEDVLSYARTLGSAYETSEINFRMKYTVRVDILRNTAYAAWYYHQQMGRKFAVAAKLWEKVRTTDMQMLITNVVSLVKELLHVVEQLSEVVDNVAEIINESLLEKGLKLGLPINWLSECDERLKLTIKAPEGRLMLNPATSRLSDADERDTWSGDDDDGSAGPDQDAESVGENDMTPFLGEDAQLDRPDHDSDENWSEDGHSDDLGEQDAAPTMETKSTSNRDANSTTITSASWEDNLPEDQSDWLHVIRHLIPWSKPTKTKWFQMKNNEKIALLEKLSSHSPVDQSAMGNKEVTEDEVKSIIALADTDNESQVLRGLCEMSKKLNNMNPEDAERLDDTAKEWRTIMLNTDSPWTPTEQDMTQLVQVCFSNNWMPTDLIDAISAGKSGVGAEWGDFSLDTIEWLEQKVGFLPKSSASQVKLESLGTLRKKKLRFAKSTTGQSPTAEAGSVTTPTTTKPRKVMDMADACDNCARDATLNIPEMRDYLKDLSDSERLNYMNKLATFVQEITRRQPGTYLGTAAIPDIAAKFTTEGEEKAALLLMQYFLTPDGRRTLTKWTNHVEPPTTGESKLPMVDKVLASLNTDVALTLADKLKLQSIAGDGFPLQELNWVTASGVSLWRKLQLALAMSASELTPALENVRTSIYDTLNLTPVLPGDGLVARDTRRSDHKPRSIVRSAKTKEKYIKLTQLLDWMESRTIDLHNPAKTLELMTVIEDVLQTNSSVKEVTDKLSVPPKTATLPPGSGKHVLMMVVGSTGEIVPMVKLGSLLVATGMYRVTICCQPDVGLQLHPEMGHIQIDLDVKTMQQLVIDNVERPDINVAVCISYYSNKAVMAAGLLAKSVDVVISNVICYPASVIARFHKADLIVTTPALEVASEANAYENHRSGIFKVDERYALNPLLQAAWLNLTGDANADITVDQLEHRHRPVYGLFPPEWLDLNTQPLKFKIEPLFAMESFVESEINEEYASWDVFVLAGSTFGASWKHVIKQLIYELPMKRILVAITFNDPAGQLCKEIGIDLNKLPTNVGVRKWVDYGAITNKLIVTHGGAGVVANVTSRPNKVLVIPMIGDNFANAKWMSKASWVRTTTRTSNDVVLKLTELETVEPGLINYVRMTEEEKLNRVNLWMSMSSSQTISCNCGREHVLCHFVGTRGDYNSIVPTVQRLSGSRHVVIITHDDLLTGLPAGWKKIGLGTNSTQAAVAAVEALSNLTKNLTGPIKHYQRLGSDSLSAIKRLRMKIDCVMTSFFTPFATRIGAYMKCPVVVIDAIPNKPFFINGKEILTGLPIVATERGDELRHTFMEALDEQYLQCKDTNPSTINVVTCHKSMYEDYVNADTGSRVHNMLVNDERRGSRTQPLPSADGANILITFGSIPTKDRVASIKALQLSLPPTMNIVLSGAGNRADFWDLPNYVPELVYPDDLSKFTVVVHHGGVGTTWNCIKASVVQVIWPIFGDQFIWEAFVKQEGLGFGVRNVEELKTVLADLQSDNGSVAKEVSRLAEKKPYSYEDDEEEVLKKLSWMASSEQHIVWPMVVEQPGQPCGINPGSYRGDVSVTTVIHDPATIQGCVRDCVTKACDIKRDAMGLVNWMTPDFDDVIRIMRLSNINFRLLIDDTLSTMEIVSREQPILNLNISKAGFSYHCTVVDVKPNGPPSTIAWKTLSEMDALGPNMRKAVLDMGMIINNMIFGAGTERASALSEITSLRFDLTTRLQRQENGIVSVKLSRVQNHNELYVVVGSSKLKSDWVYATRRTPSNSTALLYCITLADRAVLRLITTEELIAPQLDLVAMQNMNYKNRMPIGSMIRRGDWFFINNEAKKAYKGRRRANSQVLYKERIYKLIVDKTDNQPHDKYNPVEQIRNARDYVLPSGLSKTEFMQAFESTDKLYLDKKLYRLSKNQPANRMQVAMCVQYASENLMRKVFGEWYIEKGPQENTINKQLGEPSSHVMTWKEIKGLDLDAQLAQMVEDKYQLVDSTKFEYDKDYSSDIDQSKAAVVTRLIVGNRAMILGAPLAAYRPAIKGAGLTDKSYSWWSGISKKTSAQDWWATKKVVRTDVGPKDTVRSVEAMHGHLSHNTQVEETKLPTSGVSGDKTQDVPNEWKRSIFSDVANITEIPDFDSMIFWEDGELTDWLSMYAPFESKCRSTEWAQRLIKSRKHTLTKHPAQSRAVHTKVAFEEQRSIAGRLFSVKRIRRRTPCVDTVMENIYKAYFHDKANEMVSKFKSEPLYYDSKASIKWMEEHKSSSKVYDDLKKTLQAGMFNQNLSDVNVHIKLESLLKEVTKVIKRNEQQKARIIVWQRYAVAAIFSPIFTEAKSRLHQLFNNKVVYADGKTPEELSSFVRGTGDRTKYVLSTDLEQQDRQTDEPLINVEFKLYGDLGVHEDVLSAWKSVHDEWRFKGTFTSGFRRSMRLTGQATTSIGNAITTMQTHAEFIYNNRDKITFVLILGDDNCIGLTMPAAHKTLRKVIADEFNMVSKSEITEGFGEFCHFLVYKTNHGYWEMGPDFVRLKHRFEVTNGVSEATDDNLTLRTMSYAMSLGATPEVINLITKEKWPIKPSSWYDEHSAVAAMARRYECTIEDIRAHYDMLLNMMSNRTIFEKSITVMASKPRKM